jgi:hypothetical protein
MILGGLSVRAKLLVRTMEMTEDKSATTSSGHITVLLGLMTVVLHNVWTLDWRVAITILGWTTLLKGIMKIGFPGHVNKGAQIFKGEQQLWGGIIFLMGTWLFWMSFA